MSSHPVAGRTVAPNRRFRLVVCLAASATLLLVTLLAGGIAAAQVAAPHIDNLVPDRGPVGTPVVISGSGFGAIQLTGAVTFNGVLATTIVTWSDTNIVAQVPDGARTGPVVVTNAVGSLSNGVVFEVARIPQPQQTWYLAEGCTAYGFDTYVLMENTTDVDATVNITYNTTQYGSMPRPQAVNVPPNSRVTLHVNEEVPNVDVSTEIRSSQKIVCERAMYWNNRIDGHDSIGVTGAARTWYLAEGCTLEGFETWVLIQNPGQNNAGVDVTYMTSNGTFEKDKFIVRAGERFTIDVFKDVGACNVSTKVESDQDVICERSMYWDGRRGGHDSIGVTSPSQEWYLAEGSTAWGYETWLLLQNPQESAADVDVTYMTSDGPVVEPTFTMQPFSRQTILVNDRVENMDTSIEVTSDKEIIAERAMYWDNGTGKAGHDTVGMTEARNTIYLAEGSTAWGFQTFVCIQNPNDEDIEVDVTYLTNDGARPGHKQFVPANSRVTVYANDEIPDRDASIKVEAQVPIMAERSMYWHEKGGGHNSIGWSP
ncbi:MAG: DUF5719 family protein [Actinomycetia bacterium]|nr:DUF5719 family protein [Actinomycetes bacterium]